MARPGGRAGLESNGERHVNFDWSAIWAALPDLMDGVRLTVFIALVGLVGGFVVGMIASMFRAYGPKAMNMLAQIDIELIRGTPIVAQVMFLYFALPLLAHIRIDGLTAAITVNSGAYLAEVVRGALLSIPKGLTEAGLAVAVIYLILTGAMTLALRLVEKRMKIL
ncbi:ABC transporter permease subunit [Burkholderia vietnamiensis]|uniref:ABC transporter permease subunit n=1 Tax=Burkholderia vietnamiensis TaxID=60552 RepID=UPI0015947229|nr:ABC transporter permease subunit [Burkholderia vietnamiensis]CAG9198908.1 Glutamate transport membrane-spanning protein [Burkholderia vietnamiensis]